jgi:DNA-binding MarR family transcriptional regulator
LQVSAALDVVRTADVLLRDFDDLLKAQDLSGAQFNVLRILRGGGSEGLTCGDVISRLVRRDPDVTRLMDKLERRGLLERGRDAHDRRVVRTRITDAGRALLASLDEPVDDVHERQLGHMSDERLRELVAILEDVRTRRR